MDLRSDYPYFLMKNGIIQSYPSLQHNITTDVTIIGAGISGALIAHALVGTGLSVTVIDRRHVGMGSTAANTSLVQYEIDVPLTALSNMRGEKNALQSYRLCLDAVYRLNDISNEVGMDFPIKPSLQYASNDKHRHALHREFATRMRYGFDVHWLEPKDIKDKYGFSAPGAILSLVSGETDAYKLTHKLLQHCIDKGMQVYDNTTITRIDQLSKHVCLETQNGCKIKTRKVIMATGYESVNYIPKHIATLYSTYAFVSEPLPGNELWYHNSLVWETAMPYLYFRTGDDNRIFVGGKDDPFYNPQLRDARIGKKAALLQKAFNKKMPHIPVRIDFSWAGTFAGTHDGLPYIGAIPGKPDMLFALGFGGNGITFSVIAADILKDCILKRKNSKAALFSFNR